MKKFLTSAFIVACMGLSTTIAKHTCKDKSSGKKVEVDVGGTMTNKTNGAEMICTRTRNWVKKSEGNYEDLFTCAERTKFGFPCPSNQKCVIAKHEGSSNPAFSMCVPK